MSLSDTEDLIVKISNDIDDQLIATAKKHNQHPLNLASIYLARIIVMCKMSGCLDEFQKVVQEIGDDILFEPTPEVTKH